MLIYWSKFQSLVKNYPVLFIVFTLSLFFLIFGAFILVLKQGGFVPPILIRFDSLNRVNKLGTVIDIWQIWSFAPLIFLINTMLAAFSYPRLKILAYVFALASLLTAIFSFIFINLVININ